MCSCISRRNFIKQFLDFGRLSSVTTVKVRAAANQQTMSPVKLPPLPVPSLDQTLSKYLKTVRPLLDDAEYKQTRTLVDKFSMEEGPRLQALLEARASLKDNWLEEWWLNTAYLEYRDPVVLFSSPGLIWLNQNFKTNDDRLKYAASLISAALSFNTLLDKCAIPQEKSGKDPLDMSQYYKVFGTTRIPLAMRDALQYQNEEARPDNILVMSNNNIFSVKVLDDNRNILHTGAIYSMLQDVTERSKETGPPVGVLTTENRDRWARAYGLFCRSVKNVESLAEIDRALFVVNLDNPLPRKNPRNKECQTSELVLHGCGFTSGNAANRWYDKTIQFVIGAGDDGVGIAYEHSPAEGNPIGVMADFVLERLKKSVPIQPATNFPKPRKLEFEIVPEVEAAIQSAGANIDKLAADLDLFGFKFDGFGKNQIKTLKTSPDSFVQIAIQYAFYKIHQKPAAQYESATLRKYVGGRTDVIRTCSSEALEFCKSTGLPAERVSVLQNALAAHKAYVGDAMSCRGIDRHLLGLKLIAKEHGFPIPALFNDRGYIASTYFQLSTSNVPTRNDCFMIYAPLVSDGYACCYNIRDEDINFGTSSWKNVPVTDTAAFQKALKEALFEMRDILASVIQQKSKL